MHLSRVVMTSLFTCVTCFRCRVGERDLERSANEQIVARGSNVAIFQSHFARTQLQVATHRLLQSGTGLYDHRARLHVCVVCCGLPARRMQGAKLASCLQL